MRWSRLQNLKQAFDRLQTLLFRQGDHAASHCH
jgi:hypothetical protein